VVSFYENYPKVHYKNSDLFEIINGFLGKNMNLAQIKFMFLTILAICKM